MRVLTNGAIHLGDGDSYRSIVGAASSLGFSKNETLYLYYAGRYIAQGIDNTPPKESESAIRLHIYHLRYYYELTGAGIYLKGDSISGQIAKFLVFNDPMSTEIRVMATSQIITELLYKDNQIVDNPFGRIQIYKKQLRNK